MNFDVLGTAALTVITGLLLLLMLTQRGKLRTRMLLGSLAAIAAIASMVFFLRALWGSGGPDEGRAMVQLYGPCALYLLLTLWGLAVSVNSRKKLKAAKAARRAEKQAAKAAKQPAPKPAARPAPAEEADAGAGTQKVI